VSLRRKGIKRRFDGLPNLCDFLSENGIRSSTVIKTKKTAGLDGGCLNILHLVQKMRDVVNLNHSFCGWLTGI